MIYYKINPNTPNTFSVQKENLIPLCNLKKIREQDIKILWKIQDEGYYKAAT